MPRSKAEPMEEVVPETPDSTRSRRSSRISTPVTPAATAAPAPRRRAANRSSAATNTTTGGSTTANTSRNPTDTPDTSIDSAEEVEGLAQDSDELDFLTKAAPKKATTSKNTPAAAKAGTKRPVAAAASSSKGPPAGGDAPEKVRKKKFIRKPQRSYARCMTVSKRLNSHGKITNISDATSTSEEEEEEEEEEEPTLPVRRHGHYMRLVNQSDFEDDEDEDEDEDDGGGFVPAKPPKKRARNDKGKAQEKSPAAAGSSKLPTGGHAPMSTTRIAAGSHALKRDATMNVESGSKTPRIGRYMSTKKRMNWKGEVVNLADDSASEEEEEEEEEDEGGFVPTMPARKRARNNNGTAQDPVVAPATPQSKDKGKGKATAFRVEESDSELTEEEEEEDSDDPLADLHARIGASERRLRGGATRTSAAAADDGGDAVMADISAATAGSGGFMADLSRLAGLDSEEESDYEEEQDDEEMDEDDLPIIRNAQPVRAVGSAAAPEAGAVAGPSKGSMQEEQQYETAKQRKARLKSEAYQAKLKEKKTKSHYERTREALNAHHPELRTIWEDLGKLEVRKPQKAIQPDGLTIKLLPFQLEGVDWLIKQEKSEWKGGMLADEMGMGKTIQMISLFLSDVKEKKGQALVIAPTVAIMQWRNEIQKYTNGFKVLVWHGINRANSVKELQKYDIILTSYQTLERTFSKQEKGFKRKGELIFEESALHALHWHRIILDEAHNIKERSTNVAKAAFELDGDYRWCLSGTPLQNRVGELYSMIRFLGGDPYAFYYCKRCPCKSLHWTFSDKRHCDSCGHTPMHHTCFWNNEILKPIQRGGMEAGEGKEAFQRLRLLLEQVMLRRTKLERADDMGLPPRTVEVRRDTFHEEEEDLYESLYKDTTRKFSTYLGQGTVLNNYSNIFTLLTRMRQMANHPDLVLRSKTGVAQNLLADDEGVENRVCKICTDVAEDPIMSRCRHVFCRECIRQYLDTDLGKALAHDCPYCHATLTIDLEQEAMAPPIGQDVAKQGIISRLNMSKWRSSTKIEALVEELTNLRAEDKTIKSIVFSQFVNFLDLIAFRLQRAGFSICRLEGNMTPEARDKTIKHFMENPGVTVFLVSLKAGGVALNLTEASHCYLMDPWWNPSVEVQAMDRIHRLGQHRPIVVKRMIIENSIESRIIELQNKKAAMIEAAIGKDDSAMGRLSVQDLKFLFTL